MSKRRAPLSLEKTGIKTYRILADLIEGSEGIEAVKQLFKNAMGARELSDLDFDGLMAFVALMGGWLETKQVYAFDQAFTSSISTERWGELLPYAIENIPCETCYLKIPGDQFMEGVIVRVMQLSEDDRLRVNRETATTSINHTGCSIEDLFSHLYEGKETYGSWWISEGAIGIALVACGSKTYIVECHSWFKNEVHELLDYYSEWDEWRIVENALAYLCSVNADINTVYRPAPEGEGKKNAKKKRSQATWHEVGARIGSQLREYARTTTSDKPHQGGTKRAHVRRAHWHHYWIGSGEDKQLELRWLAPTIINADKPVETTMHYVPSK